MRIVHVTDVYLPRVGGIERQVHQLALRQAAAGHDVHVLTTTPSAGDDSESGVHVRRLGPGRWPRLGLVVPQAWAQLSAALTGIDPDAVHVHASVMSPLGLLAALAGTSRDVPTVVTVHSMWAHLTRPYQRVFALTGLHRRPIAWTAVSRAAADQVQLALGPTGRVGVLPNGIDPADWRLPTPVQHDEVHVVAVLRLAARKRPLALLEVLRRARQQLPPDVRLRASIVGDGRLRAAAQRYLGRHDLDWVTLLGNRTADEVRELLHEADVFVATARLESFGIAALEARCAGVPVIALAGTGVADFVAHGHEGWIADSDDNLVAALVRLAGSPDARAAMSARSRRVPPAVSWEATLRAAQDAYARAAVLAGARLPVLARPA
ncbi:MAG: glycosyltransferase family 4 protein [Actinomycetales bacterium]